MLSRALRMVVTLLAVVAAGLVGWYLWDYYRLAPWTRDGRVRADVIEVAPDVAGIVDRVAVVDNQQVATGDLLFTIDRKRYQLALDQSQANVDRATAAVAQAERDWARASKLGAVAISAASLEQYRLTLTTAQADLRAAQAALAIAQLNLERTEVRAPAPGNVTNLQLRHGDYAQAGNPVVAVVDRESFYVAGYFEETKLPRVRDGAPVRVHLMGTPGVVEGHVSGIATGIVDRERSSSPNLLANVNPTFSWVRLAQRIPVRIEIDHVPAGVKLIAGQTATVEVREDE
jgi:RND family efflux transporter MFP subunit